QRPDRHPLGLAEAVLDDRDGAVGAASAAGEHQRRVDEGADAHEHDDRVVGAAADLGQLVMAGRDRVGGRDTAVGQRDAGDGGNGVRARDSGHDLHLDSGLPAGDDLLSPAPEDEGVPAFEADYAATAEGLFDEDLADPALRHRVVARLLADVDDLRVEGLAPLLRELVEDRARTEAVGDDDIGRFQGAHTGHGQQAEVAGAGADEQDAAGCLPEEETHELSCSGVWIPAASVLPVCGSMMTKAPAGPWSRKSGTGRAAASLMVARPMSLPASTSAGSICEVARLRLASMVTIAFTLV